MYVPSLQATPTFSGAAPTNVTMMQFSPDGKYLALGRSSQPYLRIYKRNVTTNVFTELTYNGTWAATFGIRGMVWHSDSRFITTVDTGNNFQAFYIDSGETWWYYAAAAPINANYFSGSPCTGLAISPNGTQIAGAVSGSNPKAVFVASWNSTTHQYTSQNVTASFAGDIIGLKLKFLSETKIVIVCYNSIGTAAYLQTVSWNGSAWVLDGNVVTVTIGTVVNCAFSHDGLYTVFGTGTGEYMRVYKYNSVANTFRKLTAPATGASSAVYAVCFNRDGSAIITGDTTSPRLEFFTLDRTTDTLTKSAVTVSTDAGAVPSSIDRSADSLLYGVSMGASASPVIYFDPNGVDNNMVFPGFTAAASLSMASDPKSFSMNMPFPGMTAAGAGAVIIPEVMPGLRLYSGTAIRTISGKASMSTDTPSTPYTYGSPSFPGLKTDGVVANGMVVRSAAVLPGFAAAGRVGWPGTATGGWTYQSFTGAGNVSLPTHASVGALTLPALVAAGTIEMDPAFGVIIERAPFPSFSAGGNINAPLGSTGGWAFSSVMGSGAGTLQNKVTGEWGYAAFGFEGRGPDPIISEPGEWVFPVFGLDMDASRPYWTVTGMAFPKFGMTGSTNVPTGIVASAGFPGFTIAGFLSRTNHTDANIFFPQMEGGGLGGPQAQIHAAAGFPAFEGVGFLGMHNSVTAAMLFPTMTLTGRTGEGGSISISFGSKFALSIGGGMSFFHVETIKIG